MELLPMKMLDTKEAAQYILGDSSKHQTLVHWRFRKKGPAFVKLGSLVRYRQADLDAYIKKQTRTGTESI